MAEKEVKRRLYIVYFDDNNNPNEVRIAPLGGRGGHGLKQWKKRDGRDYYISIYVEAESPAQAKDDALQMIERDNKN